MTRDSTLSRDTVRDAYIEFGKRFGWPDHAKTDEHKKFIIDFDHERLAVLYNDQTFPAALGIAKDQARRFPCIADFYRGFEAPKPPSRSKIPTF